MDTVRVTGGTKKQRELAKEVAEFCIAELMPRLRSLDVDITLGDCFSRGAEGFCCVAADEERRVPRMFDIEIDSRIFKPLSKRWGPRGTVKKREDGYGDFVTCVTHEMVHVWQYCTGLLTEEFKPNFRVEWKGKSYPKTAYSKLPWERQAYRMQEQLAEEYEAAKTRFEKDA